MTFTTLQKQPLHIVMMRLLLVGIFKYKEYSTNGYVNVLGKLVEKSKPSTLLIVATNNGRDIALRLTAGWFISINKDCRSIKSF